MSHDSEIQAALDLLCETVGSDDVICVFIRKDEESIKNDTHWFYADTGLPKVISEEYLSKTLNHIKEITT